MKARATLFSRSITAKLLLFFILLTLVPLLIIGYYSILNTKKEITQVKFDQLASIGKLKQKQINSYVNNRFKDLHVLTRSQEVIKFYELLSNYHDQVGAKADGSLNITSDEYNKIYDKLQSYFSSYTDYSGYSNLYFICSAHGHIMFSETRHEDLGSNLSTGKYSQSSLAKLWNSVISKQGEVMTDFSYYPPAAKNVAFLAAPIFDEKGSIIAVLALELGFERINEIMSERTGMGTTGETYLVGEDHLMRSDSRFSQISTALSQKVETSSVSSALEGESGIGFIDDYRGVKVLSAYLPVFEDDNKILDFNWALVAEIDKKEALKSVYTLSRNELILILITLFIVSIIATILARSFTRPIIKLTDITLAIAKGDLDQEIKISRKDEIGLLLQASNEMQKNMKLKVEQALSIANGNLAIKVVPLSEKDEMGKAFKLMVTKLRGQMSEIKEVMDMLTGSHSQLLATVSQLSSSANEAATTVSEVTTTIEEVKQTAEVSNQKAKNVSQTAQKSVQISEMGIKAIEDSIMGMDNIQEQVKKISNTILKMSNLSQTIGEITSSVNDLAEQSNLLAVNASIEAVKAGEYGKGFGVVAKEIRLLADKSKQSTKQIKEILSEVQKTISSAVMATDLGGKSVEKGLELAEAAGDSISVLADSISEAAQVSVHIATSSQQQLLGMEQLAMAMQNIKDASRQNIDGTKITEEAMRELKKIIANLNKQVDQYKLEDNDS